MTSSLGGAHHHKKPHGLTIRILISMVFATLFGLLMNWISPIDGIETPASFQLPPAVADFIINDFLKTGGDIFMSILRMLVVPVVFVSLVTGASSIAVKKLGRVGAKTFVLYILTTAIAITIAITLASLLGIGHGVHAHTDVTFAPPPAPSITDILVDLFPSNPFKALVEGNMLQVIVFALLFGTSLKLAGNPGERVANFFHDLNVVIMKLIIMVMSLAPYGVFFLVANLFARLGFGLIGDLVVYFFGMLFILFVHMFVTYSALLVFLARLHPMNFFKKMYPAQLFAFSVSSSNASIPIVLETVEEKLGVKNSVAAFVIPLGATINMDGTAIMQGVATVFISNAYGIDIGLVGYLTVIGMATLASIGTAGVPSVGLITLAMVLKQVGLPVEGVALIIGVDRILDMVRTAINVSGDAVVATVVAKTERSLDQKIYNDPDA